MRSKLDSLRLNPSNYDSRNPALVVGGSVSSVAGILSLIAYFNPDLLSDKTVILILVLISFALPLLTAIFTRGFVWSPASVIEVVDEAVEKARDAAQEFEAQKKRANPEL